MRPRSCAPSAPTPRCTPPASANLSPGRPALLLDVILGRSGRVVRGGASSGGPSVHYVYKNNRPMTVSTSVEDRRLMASHRPLTKVSAPLLIPDGPVRQNRSVVARVKALEPWVKPAMPSLALARISAQGVGAIPVSAVTP